MESLDLQNPWWHENSWQHKDPHLAELEASPVPWEPAVLRQFNLDSDLIYTLRGPRQVGKTTVLKLLIRRLLHSGAPARRVFYLDCERAGVDGYPRLFSILEEYLEQTRNSGGKSRIRIFLDEVTSVRRWATALKSLADAGRLTGCSVIATGSHAVDIKKGGERMPGRRGSASGLDNVLLPMSFQDYLEVLHGKRFRQLPRFANLHDLKAAYDMIASVKLRHEIERAFRSYLLTGGYPRPVATYKRNGQIPQFIYEIYQETVLGTIQRLGHRESYFRELFAHWLRTHPNPLDWRDVSRETDIGKHDTVREYAEDLELAYFWDIVFRSHTLGNPRPAFRGAKKILIKDPFSFHTLRAWTFGFSDPWQASQEFLKDAAATGGLVESVVGSHLKRRFGPFLHYWRNKKEVDFLGFKENRLETAVEVKYGRKTAGESVNALGEIGGGILLSGDELRWDTTAHVAVIPAGLFLAVCY